MSEAARVIQGLSLTEANYKHALELLEQRFGQKLIIISAHMDNLVKLNACQGDKSYQLRYLFDQIRVQIRGLGSLGVEVDSYGSLLIPVIMLKLPSDIRLQVSRATKNNVWNIRELLRIMQEEVEARESSENVKLSEKRQSNLPNQGQFKPRTVPPTASVLYTKNSEQNWNIQCVFCKGLHYSASCDTKRDVRQRKEILRGDGTVFSMFENRSQD